MIPGILDKTLKVFKMFSTYDYIIRLNSTSILNLTKVKFEGDYWGYLNSTKLDINEDYGITEEFLKRIENLEFVSGKCICLSKAAITILLNLEVDMTIMDDIAIALAMKPYYSINLNNSFSKDIDCIEANLISCSDSETMQFVTDSIVK